LYRQHPCGSCHWRSWDSRAAGPVLTASLANYEKHKIQLGIKSIQIGIQ
jgi:hypothetical protein